MDAEQGDPTTITKAEIQNWVQGNFSNFAQEWLWEIITGQYDLEEARRDVFSFRETITEPLIYDEPEQ